MAKVRSARFLRVEEEEEGTGDAEEESNEGTSYKYRKTYS